MPASVGIAGEASGNGLMVVGGGWLSLLLQPAAITIATATACAAMTRFMFEIVASTPPPRECKTFMR
jgi:hypothetical protein